MPDRRLEQEFRKVWESAFGANGAQQRRRVDAVINHDNTINPDAFRTSLPWFVRDIFIPGAVATGANLITLAMPQGGRIRHVALAARVPPSGGQFTVQFSGGTQVVAFGLRDGERTRATGVDVAFAPGVFAGITVTAANGVEDVTISIHYSVGGS